MAVELPVSGGISGSPRCRHMSHDILRCMKRVAVVALTAVLLLGSEAVAEPGRWQITPGNPALLLDSATGCVWRLVPSKEYGVIFQGVAREGFLPGETGAVPIVPKACQNIEGDPLTKKTFPFGQKPE